MEQWHFIDGKWINGNPPLMRAFDHATWLMGGIFDGARAFDGVMPDLDLHCRRAVRSASNVGLRSPLSAGEIEEICRDGVTRFPRGSHLYIRPFMWSENGVIAPDPASTRICISVVLMPLPDHTKGGSAMISKWRRPSPEMAPTDAKAVCLYAQAGRASAEARSKGFDEAVMLDPIGNIAEFASANLWIAKDGAAITPAASGCFLNGITRQRLIQLFNAAKIPVYEKTLTPKDILEADELFSSGNFGKVMPMNQIEDRKLEIGPICRRARELYMDFAHGSRRAAA